VVLRCWSEHSRKRSRLDAATSCLHNDGFPTFPPPSSTLCFSHSTPILYNVRLHLQMLITNSLQDREKHRLFSKITALQIISHQVVLYTSWKEKSNFLFWLPEIPGGERVVLRSAIVADIKAICDRDADRVHAYFDFGFNNAIIQVPWGIGRSLISQLSLHCIKTSADMDKPYRSCADRQHQPSQIMWLEILRLLALEVSNMHLTLHALDECSNRPELLEMIHTIVQWKLLNLHFLVTSQPDIEN
jgi:hypothetical protein